jgi:Leucine-rich repeat (LRR) protein
MNEILVEDYRNDKNKITIILRNLDQKILTNLKCFKYMEDVHTLEAKKINLIKIQKSFFLNLANISYLDLGYNKLETIPKNIILLKNLKTLKLDFNAIGFIPSSIDELEKLEVLNLNNNKIKYFPSQFQNLQNLKELKIANNLVETIPIEFGLLKSIEVLHIEGNHFTQIPATLCYLKHLSELSFEWLEFLDPPFQKVIKDNLGKTIITLIRNSLQDHIKKNNLYCSFFEFVERNSNNYSSCSNKNNKSNLIVNDRIPGNSNIYSVCGSMVLANAETKKENLNAKINNFENVLNKKNNENKKEIFSPNNEDNYFSIGNFLEIKEEKCNMKKLNSFKDKLCNSSPTLINDNKTNDFISKHNKKIFYAIDNNYIGVIKALESNYDEIIKIKNIENKTPLYYCIHNNKIEIADLFISKIDFSILPNAHVYLHKAIRIRDASLVAKLLQMGISAKRSDDQGRVYFLQIFLLNFFILIF